MVGVGDRRPRGDWMGERMRGEAGRELDWLRREPAAPKGDARGTLE